METNIEQFDKEWKYLKGLNLKVGESITIPKSEYIKGCRK